MVFGLSSPKIPSKIYKIALTGNPDEEKRSLLQHLSALTSPAVRYGLTIHDFKMEVEDGFNQLFQI